LAPGVVAFAFVALAQILVFVDRVGGQHGVAGFGGDAPAARIMLSTIAGSLITVAGLTFSITVVSLQLVSQQFSPRALRNFLADRLNQLVAGSFLGIFAYCLLVLRTVRQGSGSADRFVPSLSITVAITLGVMTVGLLLVFIHHMSQTLQVSAVAGRIAHTTLAVTDQLYPAQYGRPADQSSECLLRDWWRESEPIYAYPPRPGYVQSIALDELPIESRRVQVLVAPGDFVTQRTPVLAAWDTDASRSRLARPVVVGNERDAAQDVDYGLRQLADIAIKALSPSINDPTTACTCIEYLRAVMEQLASTSLPDMARVLRDPPRTVIARRRSFEEYVETAFLQVTPYATRDVRVAATLLRSLTTVADAVRIAGQEPRLVFLQTAANGLARQAIDQAQSQPDRVLLAGLLAEAEQRMRLA
jgi:uncharacterized membrane protein